MQGQTDVYTFGGVGERGPRMADGEGNVVVTGAEQAGSLERSETRILGPDGETLFSLTERNVAPGRSERWRCRIRDADGSTIGGYEGRRRLTGYRMAILDTDDEPVARVESTTGSVGTAVYQLSNGFVGTLALEISQDGRRIGEVTCGKLTFVERAEVARDDVHHRRLVVAYCLGFPVVNGYTVYD